MFVHRGSLRQSYSIHAACRLNFERKSRFLFRTYVWRIFSCYKRRFNQLDDRPVSRLDIQCWERLTSVTNLQRKSLAQHIIGIRNKGLLDVDKHQHCHGATC